MFDVLPVKRISFEKIYRIVSLKQESFLKEYILTLTKLRSIYSQKISFFVNVFKLLANSTYGKFCQNPNNFTYANLCLNQHQLDKGINSERFLRASIINQRVVIVECKPEVIKYDSVFSVASTILDLAKLYLYNHYYNILQSTFLPR